MSKDFDLPFLIVKKYPNLTKHCNRIYQTYFENEELSFEDANMNQEKFVSKNLDRKNVKNDVTDSYNKPSAAPNDKLLPRNTYRRQPRALRNKRFNNVIPKKQKSRDSSSDTNRQLVNVKSIDHSPICSEIDDNPNSNSELQSREIYNLLDSAEENTQLRSTISISTHNNDNNTSLHKLETELTYFNSNLQSQSTLSELSEINKSESSYNSLTTASPNSYDENKKDDNSLQSFRSSFDRKMRSNYNTSDSIIPESKYYAISIDNTHTDESNLQPYQHSDSKISNNTNNISDSIVADSKYNSISVTKSYENDLRSNERKRRSNYSNNSIAESIDSKYDLISLNSQLSNS